MKKAQLLTLLLLIEISLLAQSNALLQKADSLEKKGVYTEAILLREKHLQMIQPNDTLYCDYIFSLATLYTANKEHYKATILYEKSLKIYLNNFSKNKSKLAENYNSLVLAYEAIGRFDKSTSYLKEAYKISWQYDKLNISTNVTRLGNLIAALIDIGDMKSAKSLLDTLNIYVSNFKQPPLLREWNKLNSYEKWNREIYILLTSIKFYAGIGDENNIYKLIVALEKKFLPLTKKKKEDLAHLLEAYDEIAYHYRLTKNYARAIEYYTKAEAISHQDFYRMKAAAHKAIVYYLMGNFSKAFFYVDKALTVFNFPKDNNSYYGLLALKSELLQKLNSSIESTLLLEKLYSQILNKSISTANFTTFSINQFNHKINHTQIVIFIKSGNIFYEIYQKSKQQNHLSIASHFYNLSALMFKSYYSREFYNKSLDDLNRQIIEKILTVTLEQKNANYQSVINLLENNSSKHLWKKFLSKYSENLNIPYELLYKKNKLTEELSNIEILDNKSNEDKKQQQILVQSIANLDNRINKINKRFHFFQSSEFDIANIQNKLSKKQIILRYIVADKKVFGIAILQNKIILKEIGLIAEIENKVMFFQEALKNKSFSYKHYAKKLYEDILQPFSIELQAVSNVIIIPDYFLNFLPFEVLINSTNNKMIVEEYRVSYSYSLQLWHLQNINTKQVMGTVAFAPDYSYLPSNNTATANRSNFIKLDNASLEAAEIVQINKGILYKDFDATKNNFLASLGKYGVYHLAMHAQIDNEQFENSNLIFSNNEKLFFYQLYAINFPAQMVVLSACNTGIGAMQYGEGLMSLSKALVYSGVQSSVYSLWEVPDKETSILMILFYKNLKKGQDKDKALSNAKNQFVKENPSKAHPYYWAGFIINGNIQPIKNSNKLYWYLLGSGVLLLLIVGLLKRRNKHS